MLANCVKPSHLGKRAGMTGCGGKGRRPAKRIPAWIVGLAIKGEAARANVPDAFCDDSPYVAAACAEYPPIGVRLS